MRKVILLLLLSAVTALQAQIDVRTLQLSQTHPRYLTNADGKQVTRDLIENEPWAKEVFDKLKAKADSYTRLTEAQPDWLLSRLAMYWNSHATDVYIKGESFDHAGGAKAPVPTVRYTGTRGTFATHDVPNWRMSFPMTMIKTVMSLSITTLFPAVLWKKCIPPRRGVTSKA